MQDRFKFRIWDKDKKKMFDCIQINFAENAYGSNKIKDNECSIHLMYQPHLELMQCTGLKDKHGKLIYEGDIVKTITHNPYEEHIGVIRYHTCYFSLDYKEVGKFGECGISLIKNTSDFVTLEMLGNIYENPELIGGE